MMQTGFVNMPAYAGLADVAAAGVVLCNPKFPHNIGGALRACACYGVPKLRWTGRRLDAALDKLSRIPREERMKGHKHVHFGRNDKAVDELGGTPVCVEVNSSHQNILTFDHPRDAVYVFGPEDGSVPTGVRSVCHHFVFLPMLNCANLPTAVAATMAYRLAYFAAQGEYEPGPLDATLAEDRGLMEAIAGWEGR